MFNNTFQTVSWYIDISSTTIQIWTADHKNEGSHGVKILCHSISVEFVATFFLKYLVSFQLSIIIKFTFSNLYRWFSSCLVHMLRFRFVQLYRWFLLGPFFPKICPWFWTTLSYLMTQYLIVRMWWRLLLNSAHAMGVLATHVWASLTQLVISQLKQVEIIHRICLQCPHWTSPQTAKKTYANFWNPRIYFEMPPLSTQKAHGAKGRTDTWKFWVSRILIYLLCVCPKNALEGVGLQIILFCVESFLFLFLRAVCIVSEPYDTFSNVPAPTI